MGDTMRESAQDGQPPRRRPFQFGLKHLLALPVVVALFGAVWSYFGLVGVFVLVMVPTVVFLWRLSNTWAERLVTVGIMLVLVGLLLPAMQCSYGPHPRSQCSNNLKQIALGLQNYHDLYRCFPPAYVADENGRPMHSWRVLILPFIEQEALYKQYRFDEPWDGPNNRKLAGIPLHVFACPSEEHKWASTMTSYVAVVGPQTAWPEDKSIALGDVADGASNTILVVEVKDSGIHWMEPRDLHVVQMAPGVNAKAGQGISSRHPGGANVCLADGSTRFLREDTPHEIIRGLLTIDGDETIDWDRP